VTSLAGLDSRLIPAGPSRYSRRSHGETGPPRMASARQTSTLPGLFHLRDHAGFLTPSDL
jgi:hypothetical protein